MRPRRKGEAAQLATWIDASVRQQVTDICKRTGEQQRVFVEEALRRELARRASEGPRHLSPRATNI
jgi:hypothetical protein